MFIIISLLFKISIMSENMTLEEMEATLNRAVDLTVLLKNELGSMIGNDDIYKISLIKTDGTICYSVKFTELKAAIISELDKLDKVLHKDNIEKLKQTKVFQNIMSDDQLYIDILYHCEIYNCYRDKVMYNVIKLIHKNFTAYAEENQLKEYPMLYHEKRLNTIRFFCEYDFMNKLLALKYFKTYIKIEMYEQALFLWNSHLIHLMTTAMEAIVEIHSVILITSDFIIYKQLIYSVRVLFPKLSVHLILRVFKNSYNGTMDYFHACNMLSEIIYAGAYEIFQFLFEFDDFEANYAQIIFNLIFDEIMFNNLNENLLKHYNDALILRYWKLGFNKMSCIKVIIKLITVFTVSIELNSRIQKKILKFVETANTSEFFELIDLLVSKGLCTLNDTNEIFTTTYLSKRNIEIFLCGLNRLADAGEIQHLDPNMLNEMLKC